MSIVTQLATECAEFLSHAGLVLIAILVVTIVGYVVKRLYHEDTLLLRILSHVDKVCIIILVIMSSLAIIAIAGKEMVSVLCHH